ncbi:MAG TPA: ATP-grasp domain-containing protein [Luteibaculaceae bacterium]|nr:ATP-grasp domain-containing protein [Luteibaculaceae bacterium]
MAKIFKEAGLKFGLEVSIFSYELTRDIPISFVGDVIIGKKWKDDTVFEHLQEVIEEYQIDMIIPFVDQATLTVGELKARTTLNSFVPVCDWSQSKVLFSKRQASAWYLQHGIKVPEINSPYPRIAKPDYGSASIGIQKLSSEKEEKDFFADKDPEAYLVQRFIEGVEYSVDAYVSMRTLEPVVIVPRKRLETLGGEAVKSITIKDTELIHLAKDILVKLTLKGPITLQFIQEVSSGTYYLTEINPRFGGGVVTSVGAGANIPELLLLDFMGTDLPYREDWENDMMMIRTFTEFYRKCNS